MEDFQAERHSSLLIICSDNSREGTAPKRRRKTESIDKEVIEDESRDC